MVEQHPPANQPPAARPFQFSMAQLLATFVVIGTFFGAYAAYGLTGTLIWLIGSCLCLGIFGFWRGNNALAFGSLGIGIVIGLLLPTVSNTQTDTSQTKCSLNLKQIGLALHNYADHYGSFPPAFVADENGKPMHSWRVLILPFMEQRHLYDQYDFSEPWDGPNNSALAAKMPRLYACPSDRAAQRTGTTNYLAVVGPGAPWPGSKPGSLAFITLETILVVEVVGANVCWMEPRDISLAKLKPIINDKQSKGISSLHDQGANVLTADGAVYFLRNDTPSEELRARLAPPDPTHPFQ